MKIYEMQIQSITLLRTIPTMFGIPGLELSQEEEEEEGKKGGRKGDIEMGHL